MSKLIVLVGPPASGKTTWARAWVAKDPEHRVIAHDEVQAKVDLEHGYDVVLDVVDGEKSIANSVGLARRVTQIKRFTRRDL